MKVIFLRIQFEHQVFKLIFLTFPAARLSAMQVPGAAKGAFRDNLAAASRGTHLSPSELPQEQR